MGAVVQGLAHGVNTAGLQEAVGVGAPAEFAGFMQLEEGIKACKGRRAGKRHTHGDVGLYQVGGQGL